MNSTKRQIYAKRNRDNELRRAESKKKIYSKDKPQAVIPPTIQNRKQAPIVNNQMIGQDRRDVTSVFKSK